MTPEELLRTRTEFHYDEFGNPISWAISNDALEFIHKTLPPRATTFETGSGVSTVFFAMVSAAHTAVALDGREFDSIRSFCAENDIHLDHVSLIQGRSEIVVPKLELPALDLVLVDGRHAFPSPYIDWFYTAEALKVGGTMVIDDTQILTGQVLTDFMSEHPSWKRLHATEKTSFFTKLDNEVNSGEWNSQPYIMNRQ